MKDFVTGIAFVAQHPPLRQLSKLEAELRDIRLDSLCLSVADIFFPPTQQRSHDDRLVVKAIRAHVREVMLDADLDICITDVVKMLEQPLVKLCRELGWEPDLDSVRSWPGLPPSREAAA